MNKPKNKAFVLMIGYQNSIIYLLGHLAHQIRRLRIERSQIHPDDSDDRGEMKTRKTTFVAVLSQTLTTTSTSYPDVQGLFAGWPV